MMQDGMMGPMMMVPMMIVTILVLAALIAGIVWLVRTLADSPRSNNQRRATEVLEMRYARGELDRDEYLQRREDLQRLT